MSSRIILTIVLAIVLMILVVPFGGPAAPLGVLIIAALAGIDIYRQLKQQERAKTAGPIAAAKAPNGLATLPANALLLPPGRRVEVRGESQYEAAFDAALGRRNEDGARGSEITVVLRHDADNPYDPNAVAVLLGGQVCGHVAREAAPVLAPVVDAVVAAGKVPACQAILSGGWDRGGGDRGHYGIELDLADPKELLASVGTSAR